MGHTRLIRGLVVLALLTSAAAQEPAETFRAETELVLVPVTVTDRDNRHIPALAQQSFQARLNGKVVELSIFDEVTGAEASLSEWKKVQNDGRGNAHSHFATPAPMSILLLDYLNSGRPDTLDDFADRAMGFAAMLQFLAEHSASSEQPPVAFYTLGRRGIQQVFEFSEHPGVVAAAVRHLQQQHREEPLHPAAAGVLTALKRAHDQAREDVSTYQDPAHARHRIDLTLDALLQLGETYKNFPGRKSLIWVTSSAPLLTGAAPDYHLYAQYERTWRALSTALISAYPVDIRGLVVLGSGDIRPARIQDPPRPPMHVRESTESWRLALSIDAMKRAAETTGGRAFYGRNDLAVAVREAMEESRSYYLLGFYAPRGALREGWQRISVRVRNRAGVASVRHRTGFYVSKSRTDESETSVATALASPIDLPGVPLRARLELGGGSGEKRQATVHLSVAARGLALRDDRGLLLEFVVAARTVGGVTRILGQRRIEVRPETADARAKLEAEGIRYSATVELEEDDLSLRVVVLDVASGGIGTVSLPIQNP